MADKATFVMLVKVAGSGPSSEAGAGTVMEDFVTALNDAVQRTGSRVRSTYAAQGAYDFIVDVTIDPEQYAARNPGVVDTSGVTAQQVAVGFAGALANGARTRFSTETVPVVSVKDRSFIAVYHSCTLDA
jgi:uncharacterized protein with GYD domain